MKPDELIKLQNKARRFHELYLSDGRSESDIQLMSLRERFINRFTLDFIRNELSLENYCLGRGNHDSFSYWIEFELQSLGSVRGGAADKFIVFYSNKRQNYQPGHLYPQDLGVSF